MTTDESKEFSKYTDYYNCLKQLGIGLEKDGRYCHSNYLTSIGENIYYEKGVANPVVNTTDLQNCLSDP